jgi:hypothetical protein
MFFGVTYLSSNHVFHIGKKHTEGSYHFMIEKLLHNRFISGGVWLLPCQVRACGVMRFCIALRQRGRHTGVVAPVSTIRRPSSLLGLGSAGLRRLPLLACQVMVTVL